MNRALKMSLASLFFALLFLSFHEKEKTVVFFNSIKEETKNELKSSKVIEITNQQRILNNLEPLIENEILNKIAESKIKDMDENQYFDHVSPSNEKIGDLVEKYNYKYIGIGENLAMGNFNNEEELVDGWMNSPGHRENILNFGFKEIGVSVKEINYQEKKFWFSVQVFALPKSSCPQENFELISLIDIKKNELDKILIEIKEVEREIMSINKTKGKINDYNNLITKYNLLLQEIKILTDKYNKQVNIINKCINEYGY